MAMAVVVLGITHWVESDWARVLVGGPAGALAYLCVVVDDEARRAVAQWWARRRRRAVDLDQAVAATLTTLPGTDTAG
jgi:hypothetical protein